MSELEELINKRLMNTIGYSESSNKREFSKGAMMATSFTEEYFNEKINSMDYRFNHLNNEYQDIRKDIEDLTRIITKYSKKI